MNSNQTPASVEDIFFVDERPDNLRVLSTMLTPGSANQQPALASKGDILIVDDAPDNLRVLSTMLTEQGYQVRKVINGYLALTAANMAPPDLILLDVLMPQMDGYEVCSQLKSSEKTCEIPVIFISALGEVIDKVKAFEVGE